MYHVCEETARFAFPEASLPHRTFYSSSLPQTPPVRETLIPIDRTEPEPFLVLGAPNKKQAVEGD